MITYNGSVHMSVSVAKALLAFASKDATRTHLCGVGLSRNDVGAVIAATDGHTLVSFPMVEESPFSHDRRVWSRQYVETQMKIAQATKSDVVLEYGCLTEGSAFPPVAQVEPKAQVTLKSAIGLDAKYLARLDLVTKACDAKGALLSSLTGELNPIRFDVSGREGQTARVTIMPMRL